MLRFSRRSFSSTSRSSLSASSSSSNWIFTVVSEQSVSIMVSRLLQNWRLRGSLESWSLEWRVTLVRSAVSSQTFRVFSRPTVQSHSFCGVEERTWTIEISFAWFTSAKDLSVWSPSLKIPNSHSPAEKRYYPSLLQATSKCYGEGNGYCDFLLIFLSQTNEFSAILITLSCPSHPVVAKYSQCGSTAALRTDPWCSPHLKKLVWT